MEQQQTDWQLPAIPVGRMIAEIKRYQEDMEDLGLTGDLHPTEVFMIAVKSGITNPYQEKVYIDLHEARRLKKGLEIQHGKGTSRIFKVTIKLNDNDPVD